METESLSECSCFDENVGDTVEVPYIDNCTIADEIGDDAMTFIIDTACEEEVDDEELILCYVSQVVV